MAKKIYDVIVVGTGAGGGTALKALCEAGLHVLALNNGPRIVPSRAYRMHRQPFETKYRGFGDPTFPRYHDETEYTQPCWEHDVTYVNAPGTNWEWVRCKITGGKGNFWGRSSARFGEIDFRAASLDGFDVDWPVTYDEIAPYFTRAEKMMGIASTIQNRPSNPDGVYLPAIPLRCGDYILQEGAKKVGVPYLPDRCAQLTIPQNGHPPCHYCANCGSGCDTGSFFSPTWFTIPDAEKTGRLELRADAIAKNVLVDENGQAKGVAYVDRNTKQEVEVYSRAVVVAASCVETTHILLNSKSRHWSNGIGNSSDQLGRNLCDHLYGTPAYGVLPQLAGQPSRADNISAATIVWMPRWQNLKNPHEETFIRGYCVYSSVGCDQFPWYAREIEGFGVDFKRSIKHYYPAPFSFATQAPSLPNPDNFLDIDPQVKDIFGIPALRIHFHWEPNVLAMWEHSKQVMAELVKSAGGEVWGVEQQPKWSGKSNHEFGPCRMGNDPKKFYTNAFGQSHDVRNLYICDASVFVFPGDKTTTMPIVAFTLRTCDHIIQKFRRGDHRRGNVS
ncbi:MAG: GMC oxidoreductase [Terriglobia bacterium]